MTGEQKFWLWITGMVMVFVFSLMVLSVYNTDKQAQRNATQNSIFSR